MFRKIYIEITTQCNRSCDFCPGTTRPARFMDKELFGYVLEQLCGMGKLLHFHVMGEPLLHPEIGEFLDMCSSYKYGVNIVTNGLLLPSVGPSIIGKPALKQLSVSLHHLSPDTPDNEVEDYFQGIGEFIEQACRISGLFVSLRLWNRRVVAGSAFWEAIERRIADMFSMALPLIYQCNEHTPVRLSRQVWLNAGKRFEWPTLSGADHGDRGTCLGLREQMAVLVDGTVVPCCLDCDGAMALGNIGSSPLRDILQSPRSRSIAEGFARGMIVEKLCRRCAYRLRFDQPGFLLTE